MDSRVKNKNSDFIKNIDQNLWTYHYKNLHACTRIKLFFIPKQNFNRNEKTNFI